MEQTITEHMYTGIAAILSLSLSLFAIGIFNNNDIKEVIPQTETVSVGDNTIIRSKAKPKLDVKSALIDLNQTFDYKNYVTALTYNGSNAIDKVKVYGSVNTSVQGEYIIAYVLEDNGFTLREEATYLVE